MSRFNSGHLFSSRDLREYLEAHRKKMYQAIENYNSNKLLNTPVDDLVEYFAAVGSIDAPEIIDEGIYVDQAETKVDFSRRFEYAVWDRSQPHYVPGTSVSLHVPFSGEVDLLQCRASKISLGPTYAQVLGNEIIIERAAPQVTPEEVKRQFDGELEELRKQLGWVQNDVRSYNLALSGQARQAVDARRQRLLDNQKLVASLGYPLKKRPSAPMTYALPDVRRKAVPKPPQASTAPFVPEPALSDEIYEHILTILGNMVQVMEQSPGAFATMGEEDLRTHFLVQLNGQFEGRASGETFHGSGKTDILLRERDKSIFIAECKFWKGPASLTKAIDQLLDYATWRDAKAALLMFNRNKDFSAVVEQVPDLVRQHPKTTGDVQQLAETVFRSKLNLRDDASRRIILTTMVFNVPVDRSTSDRLKGKQ